MVKEHDLKNHMVKEHDLKNHPMTVSKDTSQLCVRFKPEHEDNVIILPEISWEEKRRSKEIWSFVKFRRFLNTRTYQHLIDPVSNRTVACSNGFCPKISSSCMFLLVEAWRECVQSWSHSESRLVPSNLHPISCSHSSFQVHSSNRSPKEKNKKKQKMLPCIMLFFVLFLDIKEAVLLLLLIIALILGAVALLLKKKMFTIKKKKPLLAMVW